MSNRIAGWIGLATLPLMLALWAPRQITEHWCTWQYLPAPGESLFKQAEQADTFWQRRSPQLPYSSIPSRQSCFLLMPFSWSVGQARGFLFALWSD